MPPECSCHAGFIVGFDSEKGSVADGMVDLIEDAAIPVCMVGLLYALPNTQLTRRLERGRPPASGARCHTHGPVDQCTQGLNFDTLRPKQEILLDYKRVLERIYEPVAYAGRLQRLAGMLDNSTRKRRTRADDARRRFGGTEMIAPDHHQPARAARYVLARTFTECMSSNPRSARWIVALMALYLHLGPFSRYVIRQIEQKIEEIERDGLRSASSGLGVVTLNGSDPSAVIPGRGGFDPRARNP